MNRKNLTGLMIILVCLLAPLSDTWGFDGLRKGFVIGGGLGFTPIARLSASDILQFDPATGSLVIDDFSETEAGVGVNLLLGYAWNEYNMIVYEGNASGYKSRPFAGDLVLTQGFFGATWYHYYGPKGATFFSAIGIGFYQFDVERGADFDAGVGGMLGGGYEFSPHFQAGAYFSSGKTSIGSEDWKHLNISALVSAVAF